MGHLIPNRFIVPFLPNSPLLHAVGRREGVEVGPRMGGGASKVSLADNLFDEKVYAQEAWVGKNQGVYQDMLNKICPNTYSTSQIRARLRYEYSREVLGVQGTAGHNRFVSDWHWGQATDSIKKNAASKGKSRYNGDRPRTAHSCR